MRDLHQFAADRIAGPGRKVDDPLSGNHINAFQVQKHCFMRKEYICDSVCIFKRFRHDHADFSIASLHTHDIRGFLRLRRLCIGRCLLFLTGCLLRRFIIIQLIVEAVIRILVLCISLGRPSGQDLVVVIVVIIFIIAVVISYGGAS